MQVFKRISFHIQMFLSNLWYRLCPNICEEVLSEMKEELRETVTPEGLLQVREALKEYEEAEPVLDRQRTMLILPKRGEKGCNFLTARSYRRKVVAAYNWAKARNIDTFLVDYTKPFSLLALETLIGLKESGEDIRIYSFKESYLVSRKSYRLIPETAFEIFRLTIKADYDYRNMTPGKLAHLVSHSAVRCTERGICLPDKELLFRHMEEWGEC